MEYRRLNRAEIARISEIDRSEEIENIYFYQNSKLVLIDKRYHMHGFPQGELLYLTQHLQLLYDQGGVIFGAFEKQDIIGIIAMESKLRGVIKDHVLMDSIFVSKNFRNRGIGRKLVELVILEAVRLGAKKLYISATPSKNTIDFYLHLGCVLTNQLDHSLIDMEPYDIHLELLIRGDGNG